MTAGPTIRLAATESGIRLLGTTIRTFTRPLRARVGGRILVTSLGTSDPRQVSLQAGFLRLVSITEATVDSIAAELTAGQLGSPTPQVLLLAIEKELAATSNWAARVRAFKVHHDLSLHGCDEFKRVEAAGMSPS